MGVTLDTIGFDTEAGLLPDQYFDRRQQHSGEKRLMLAVLEDAINRYKKFAFSNGSKQQKLYNEADAYIRSRDRIWPFSFENVCMSLELDPDYIRRGLNEWKRKHVLALQQLDYQSTLEKA